MLRNEADILPTWLHHMAALCDRIFVVDHLSTDGSSEILHGFASAGMPIRVWRMEEPGYWQSAVTTELARHAFQSGADWILPFDVDEFLEIESKEALQGALDRQKNPLGFWRWRHAVPVRQSLTTGKIDWPSPELLANPDFAPANGGKIVLHRAVSQRLPAFRLGSGNHLLHGLPFAKAIRGEAMGALWHLPVRSRGQIIRKLRRDVASHANSRAASLPELEGAGRLKQQLLDRIENDADDMKVLQRVGLGYGEIGIRCLDDPDLLARAVSVSPKFVMAHISELPSHYAVNYDDEATTNSQAKTDLALAKARLLNESVAIKSENFWPYFLFHLENILGRYFTPGLRLARFISTQFVAWRLNMRVGSKN